MARDDLEIDALTALEAWKGFLNLDGVSEAIAKGRLNPLVCTLGYKFPHPGMEFFDKVVASFREPYDTFFCAMIQDRWITTIKKAEPVEGIPFVKLVQNRPGKTDPSGLEHIDVRYCPGGDLTPLREALEDLSIHYEAENNAGHRWFSVRLDKLGLGLRELKFIDHSLWGVCIAEMKEA
jgi:hypothetical protein